MKKAKSKRTSISRKTLDELTMKCYDAVMNSNKMIIENSKLNKKIEELKLDIMEKEIIIDRLHRDIERKDNTIDALNIAINHWK